jgi:hypothetical protein
LIPSLRRPNGLEKRKKNFSTLPKFSPLSGVLLRPLLVVPQPNASSTMKSCSTVPRANQETLMILTHVGYGPVRLTRTPRPSLADQTQSTWMKMRKKCCRSVGQD